MAANNEVNLDVAILGGGFTGVACARRLGRVLGRKSEYRVGLIAEQNYMVFQPMLPEVAGAAISPRHVVNPLRLLCRRSLVFKGVVDSIDWPGRTLTLNAGSFSGRVTVRYKHLVLGLGAVIDLRRIPGMPEHSFLMQNVGDAMFLRTTIIGRIEEANLETRPEVRKRLLTFVVVGGGYSGAETAGHILDLFASIHRFYPSISKQDLNVVLVHSREHLLPTLRRRLGDYCGQQLKKRGLTLMLEERVKAVTANQVFLESGVRIESNTVVCTVGNAPHPLITELCEKDGFEHQKGRVVTENTCRVPGQDALWAGGDCATVPFIEGGTCPDTAQFATRQGATIGDNIAASLRGQPLKTFRFKGLGEMASIGHRVAVAEVFGIPFSGFVAWWMWRTIYLSKLPRLDRKLRVVLDWTLDLFFPRDINLLSPRHTSLLKEIHLEPGDKLFEKGEPAFSLYLIKDGTITVKDETGPIQQVSGGEFLGERALLDDKVWHYDAEAAESSTLVSIPAKTFLQIVRRSGSLGRLFRKSAARYQSREIIAGLVDQIPEPIRKRPVRDLMQTDVQTMHPEWKVSEGLSIAKAHPHGAYPVVDDGGKVLGVILRDDFYEFLKLENDGLDQVIDRVARVQLPTTNAEQTVAAAMEQLIRSGASKLLVTDEAGTLRGIVTVIDFLNARGADDGAGQESV